MPSPIVGLHHVTAIAGDPRTNVEFYTAVLGLRLVKRTVNFDAPDTYHLYYGDKAGHPGTILTFFSWPGAPKGRHGTGQVTVTAFSVPENAMGYWRDRLTRLGFAVDGPVRRFDEDVLTVRDPDGLRLELVAHTAAERTEPWCEGPIPISNTIRGFHGVTICAASYERTARLLTETMGFGAAGTHHGRFRFVAGEGLWHGSVVDIVRRPGHPPGSAAAGTVHHIAFRVPDGRDQLDWRDKLVAAELDVTPPIDRQYFQSIYFREPGGVLFELATDPPGFIVDETIEELGTDLKLPPWLESSRRQIEALLPPIQPALGNPS